MRSLDPLPDIPWWRSQIVWWHACFPHSFRSVEGLFWGAEPRFEPRPALRLADALLSEHPFWATRHPNHAAPQPRRTLTTPHPYHAALYPCRTLKPQNDFHISWWWIVCRLLAAAWPWWCCTPASSVCSSCGPPLASSLLSFQASLFVAKRCGAFFISWWIWIRVFCY